MSDLETFARTLAADHNLGVLVTTRPDHSESQVSVVNVGVIAHPSTAERTVAFADIYHAAGGQHPDLNHYGDVMVAERRCAVLLRPQRFWSNPPGSEHLEPANTRATSS
jgi:hypothetical protein